LFHLCLMSCINELNCIAEFIMKKTYIATAISFLWLLSPGLTLAATNCDSMAKPAFGCPTGFSMVCIPTGGDHWGCSQAAVDGGIVEAPLVAPTSPDVTAVPSTETPIATTVSDTNSVQNPTEIVPTIQPSAGAQPAVTTAPPAPKQSPSATEAPVPTLYTAGQDAPSLESVGEAMDFVAENAPDSLKPIFAAIASTVATMLALLGIWEWLKRLKEKKTSKCDRCGKKSSENEPCLNCDGKGTVEEEYEATVKCEHCKGSGLDPCHNCGGTGKMTMPNAPQSPEELEALPPCDFCGGTGKKRVGAGHDMHEANEANAAGQGCCMCHGKKEESYKAKRQVPCPVCKK